MVLWSYGLMVLGSYGLMNKRWEGVGNNAIVRLVPTIVLTTVLYNTDLSQYAFGRPT